MDIEQQRKLREAEAHRRDALLREERKQKEDRERQRQRKEQERRYYDEKLRAKDMEKKAKEVAEAEMRSRMMQAQLGDKRAQQLIDEAKQQQQGPRPYTGEDDA